MMAISLTGLAACSRWKYKRQKVSGCPGGSAEGYEPVEGGNQKLASRPLKIGQQAMRGRLKRFVSGARLCG